MLGQVERGIDLYQDEVVLHIQLHFGQEHIYFNEAGNEAISKKVLAEFRKLSGDRVVWSRSERYWRLRDALDDPSRMQE